MSLPNSSAIKEIVLTKGKRKKRESARKLNQKEMKHNKRKVYVYPIKILNGDRGQCVWYTSVVSS